LSRAEGAALRRLTLIVLLADPATLLAQGMPQGPEFRVNTYTTTGQAAGAVASTSAGDFLVVWVSQNQAGDDVGIFGQRYAGFGAPLGGEFHVNTYTTNQQRNPSVACALLGDFVVAWHSLEQDGSGAGIFAQRYAATGAPLGSEFQVNSYTGVDQAFPAVAFDANGAFVVAWASATQDGSLEGIFAQRYASAGFPLGAEFRVNTYTPGAQSYPAVASDSAGNFVVVWSSDQQDGSGLGIFAQRYSFTGAPLGGEFRVNSYTTSQQRFPSVASNAFNFVVAWQSFGQDGDSEGVFAQRYSFTGAPLGGEFRVNSYTTSFQSSPTVASDAGGNFVVGWQSYTQDDPTDAGVFAQRFLGTGVALGGEFRVNTYTTGSQFFPAVTSDLTSNFVVVWTSYMQDGSSFGVFGQRYSSIVPVELQDFEVE